MTLDAFSYNEYQNILRETKNFLHSSSFRMTFLNKETFRMDSETYCKMNT